MTAVDARRFLDRIFQFRLEIPQFPKRDMRNYALHRLERDLPRIAEDLRSRGEHLETIIDRMIHVGVQSPRNALQILNAFAQSWWIAQQREREGAGTEKAGGLHDGAVTNHPLSLAVLSALRVDFADFYENLQREPDLIGRFSDVFVSGKKLDDQPETTKAILSLYTNQDGKLKSSCRALRQFLAGNQGLRWPKPLQPLLTLSEDPVTRKFGDKGPRLYDGFVSGDQAGVLAELGRDADSKLLSYEDVRLLHDMEEELRHESPTRQDNAARVIAALADRLPGDKAHLLVSPLARRLSHSRALRSFVGINRIQTLLPKASADDRRELAAHLIEDLLRTQGEIEFTLPTGETPSLDEAIEIVLGACEVVLSVRSEDRLDNGHDQLMLNWLEQRSVAISGQNHEFRFSQLELWMAQHEKHLLPDLKGRYTRMVLVQLEQDDLKDFDVTETLRRTREIFDDLWNTGQESRDEMWIQLNALVTVRNEAALSLACQFLSLHMSASGFSEHVTVFARNLAVRLKQDREDADWELDWKSSGQTLLRLLDHRSDIGSEAHDALVDLAISWSGGDQTVEFGIRLLTWLRTNAEDKAGAVVRQWTGRIISDLPEECVTWLGSQFDSLTAEQQSKLTEALEPIHSRTKFSDEEFKRFVTFMRHLSDDAIKTSSVQRFMEKLYPFVQQQHANPSQYLQGVFPALPRIIGFGPHAQAGAMLHNLFANARNSVSLYGWLHEQMTGYWPSRSTELNPYNPTQIFDAAVQTMNEYPNDGAAPKILLSVSTMIHDETIDNESAPRVIEGACLLWPHYQSEALTVLLSHEQLPALKAIRQLMDSVDYENSDSRDNLQKAWVHFSNLLSDDQLLEVAKIILVESPKGSNQEPDAAFALWINIRSDRKTFVLRTLTIDPSIDDSQRKRVWFQIERSANKLGREFFLAELPRVFALDNSAETLNAVFESRDIFSHLFNTASDTNKLAARLIESLKASSSRDAKNRLAQWLKSIGGGSALKQLQDPNALRDEDIEILWEQFPESKVLKHLRELRERRNSE